MATAQEGRSRRQYWLWGLAAGAALAGALIWTATEAATALYAPRRTAPDVVVAGIRLNGLDRHEAATRLRENAARVERVTWMLDGLPVEQDVRLVIDVETTLEAVFAIGRSGDLRERVQAWRSLEPEHTVPALWKVAGGEAHRLAEFFRPLAYRAPVNAELRHSGDRIWIEPDRPGRQLDEGTLTRQVLDVARGIGRFDLPAKAATAEVTAQSLRALGLSNLRGKMTTYYNAANHPRTNNILVASRAIREVMLAPGEVFSFNQRVGPRTVGRGYQVAQVILADALVPGLGDGICQVSSTLYAAAVQAGATILERTNHSLPIWYMEPGLDATVSWGGPDLVFRNDTGQHLLVTISADSAGAVTVRFFGPPGGNSRLESVVMETYAPPVHVTEDPTLPPGEEVVDQAGQQGVKAALYSVSATERNLVNVSVYQPYPRKVRRGPAPTDPPGDEAPPEDPPGNGDGGAGDEGEGAGGWEEQVIPPAPAADPAVPPELPPPAPPGD